MRRASSGSKASYKEAGVWVFRLSSTTRILGALGKWTSTRSFIAAAKSCFVRRLVTSTSRQPKVGSRNRKGLQVPSLSYSYSIRFLFPGWGGKGSRTWSSNGFGHSSKQILGELGSAGSAERSSTSYIRQTKSEPTVGMLHCCFC